MKKALITLQEFHTPEKIITKSIEEIVARWLKGVQILYQFIRRKTLLDIEGLIRISAGYNERRP